MVTSLLKKKTFWIPFLGFFLIGGLFFSGLLNNCVYLTGFQKTAYHPIQEGKYHKSYIEIKDSIPILHLYGSPYEQGKAAGFLLQKQIKALMNHYIRVLFHGSKYQKGLKTALKLEKKIPKRFIDEMKGMSEASKVPYNDILLANTFLDMQSLVLCSTFIAQSAYTKDGHLLFARNLDFPSLDVAHHYDLIVVHHMKSHHDFMTVTWPGLVGVISGINEHGLTATMLVSLSGNRSSDNKVPCILAFRDLLEQKKDVKGAIRFFRSTQIASPNNLSVADAKDQGAVFELSPFNKAKVRLPKGQSIYCTNYFMTNGNTPVYGRRYRALKAFDLEYKKSHKKIDLASMKKILAKVALKRINLQAMIFIPSLKKLYLSMDTIPAASGVYKEIDLQTLFDQEK